MLVSGSLIFLTHIILVSRRLWVRSITAVDGVAGFPVLALLGERRATTRHRRPSCPALECADRKVRQPEITGQE
jgi:hypothetical protein